MSSTESKLMGVAILLSLLLVLALGTIAVFTVLGQDDDTGSEVAEDTTEGLADEVPAPATPSPGGPDDGTDLGAVDPPALALSLIHISEPTRPSKSSRMPSSA